MSGIGDIVISQAIIKPAATDTVSTALNLDATASIPAAAIAADAAGTEDTAGNWLSAANFSTVITIYDSLGQAHDLNLVFRKTATANQWQYRVLANGGEVTGGTAGKLRQIDAAGGLLAFKADGTLDTANSNITAIGPVAWADGASAQTIAANKLVFTGSSQFALPSAVNSLSQNGTPSGVLQGITIGRDGVITGQFSTGGSQPLFRIALADFSSPQGLEHVGNSLFQESPASGQPIIGSPDDGGFGSLLSGTLELSTVDLATEFVKMVTTQRGFQASSRIITVTDTMLEEIANLKR